MNRLSPDLIAAAVSEAEGRPQRMAELGLRMFGEHRELRLGAKYGARPFASAMPCPLCRSDIEQRKHKHPPGPPAATVFRLRRDLPSLLGQNRYAVTLVRPTHQVVRWWGTFSGRRFGYDPSLWHEIELEVWESMVGDELP